MVLMAVAVVVHTYVGYAACVTYVCITYVSSDLHIYSLRKNGNNLFYI